MSPYEDPRETLIIIALIGILSIGAALGIHVATSSAIAKLDAIEKSLSR